MADARTLSYATVAELGRMIRSGEVSPTELAEHFLARLDTVGRSLNGVVTLVPELAMAEAKRAEDELAHGVDRGPLHGIPYGAKDLLATAGIPTTWGMAPLRDQVFDRDAAVIERLREAGAVLAAKVSMVEGAGGFGYEQPNAALNGPGKSAWNSEAWSGGSSSGSGSVVGAGCVPFAIGTETWGSIHVPAAFNGITGFRPTYGRVSRAGAMALSWSMDKIGPMAHSVEDCDVILRVIAGEDPRDPATGIRPLGEADHRRDGFRIAVLAGSAGFAQDEVRRNFEASLDELRAIGRLEEVTLPDLPMDEAASVIVIGEGASAFEELIEGGASDGLTAPEDRAGLFHAMNLPAVDYIRALRLRRLAARAMDELLAPFDVVVAPTVPYVATPINDSFATWFGRERGPGLGGPGNLCGLPSISAPNGFGERGLPTAIEFLGRAYSEPTVAAVARAYQDRTAWHREKPAH